jgi:hypothetical protein
MRGLTYNMNAEIDQNKLIANHLSSARDASCSVPRAYEISRDHVRRLRRYYRDLYLPANLVYVTFQGADESM